VLGHRVIPLQPGAMGWRIELGRLLEHNGLAAGSESDSHEGWQKRETDAAQARTVKREGESREQSSRCHCALLSMIVCCYQAIRSRRRNKVMLKFIRPSTDSGALLELRDLGYELQGK
jgi:hypothetical protein